MKKLCPLILCTLFSLSAASIETVDYTQGLSVWFDTPNNLDGQAIWLRANGTGANPDKAWESRSLPIGNGSLGANIMGSISAERITLNEKTLWKGGPNTAKGAEYYWNVNKQSSGVLKEIRQAFLDGDSKKAGYLTQENFNGLGAYEEKDETPFRFGAFTTMGELYVETGLSEINMSNYRRILSLDSAMAVVQFYKDGIRYQRKYFISYPDSVMVMKFTADKGGKQNLVLSYCPNNEAKSHLEADGNDGLVYTGVLNNNDIFGFTAPLSSKSMAWNLNPTVGPWLATHIWEYYDYTRDTKFLKEIGYDLIKSSAQFAVDHLWHKPDGTYTAAPSTSPEHGPVDEGVTFAHAVVREILLDAIQASKVLGTDAKERKQWENVLAKLVPYRIGRYGQLLEWSTDIDDPKDEHRHVNHLFGLHPGHTISPVTTPELAQAARVVLEHRGDGATGWSMGWKLNQWARLQDGNHAYKLYGNLLKNGTLDNLWDTHAPFQIDGNFGGTAGIIEMLLQSHMGFIQLLPALPDAWANGSISGICAKGNFEVSISWKEGQLEKAIIHSKSGIPCNVRYGDKTLKFKTVKGKKYEITLKGDKLAVL